MSLLFFMKGKDIKISRKWKQFNPMKTLVIRHYVIITLLSLMSLVKLKNICFVFFTVFELFFVDVKKLLCVIDIV